MILLLDLPLGWYDHRLTVYIYGLYKARSVELHSNDTTSVTLVFCGLYSEHIIVMLALHLFGLAVDFFEVLALK